MSGVYEWICSESAPRGYPMKVLAGDLGFPDGSSLYVPANKIIEPGWGLSVSTHLVGEDLKPVPDRLAIAFYSYTEDRFYDGTFVLPHARMQDLFAQGHRSYKSGERITFHRIVVGVAPGGAVSVWLVSSDRTVEVFFGYAAEADFDFALVAGEAAPPRERYVADKLREILPVAQRQQLQTDGVPLGCWERFRERYPWRPAFEGPSPRAIAPLRFWNGEVDWYPCPVPRGAEMRPVPSFLEFQLPRLAARPLRYLLSFDEAEIFDAYRRLARRPEPMELVLATPAPSHPLFSVYLRSPHERVPLAKTDVTFRTASSSRRP